MNLYLLSQNESNGYNTYDSAIVVAEDEIAATYIHPNGHVTWNDKQWIDSLGDWYPSWYWTDPKNVTAQLIGTALDKYTEPKVIYASYNAGS